MLLVFAVAKIRRYLKKVRKNGDSLWVRLDTYSEFANKTIELEENSGVYEDHGTAMVNGSAEAPPVALCETTCEQEQNPTS